MKITNKEAVSAKMSKDQALSLGLKMQGRLIYTLDKHKDILDKITEDYLKLEKATIEKWCDKEEDGETIKKDFVIEDGKPLLNPQDEPIWNYSFNDHKEEFEAELKEIQSMEVEVPDYKSTIDHLDSFDYDPLIFTRHSDFNNYFIK